VRTRLSWLQSTLAVISVLAVLAGLPAASGAVVSPADPAYQKALRLGSDAYVYGIPLLDSDRVFLTSTSVNVPNGSGGGPVNTFSHVRRLANPNDKTVVAPNHDTLYSMAWLDLTKQPIIAHMPVVGGKRFVVFELVDPYTTNFAAIGSVGHGPGNYAITAPGWHGRLPRGVKRIRAPYTRVWVIGRTYIVNAADTPNVVRIQNKYGLTPLSKWARFGSAYHAPRPKHIDRTLTQFTVPGTTAGSDPLAFYDSLGDLMKRFPPPTADRPLLTQLASVGIAPGAHPSQESTLSAATLQGLRDGIAAGEKQVKADVQSLFLHGAPKHNGWLVARTGTYGTDYSGRAAVDQVGLGAPVSTLAMYPFTVTDRDLHPLNGANRYVAHVAAKDLPFPARSFWSLTLYDSHGFFVPNSAHVYLINNRSHVHLGGDGSLDIYIQPNAPTNATQRANWLPSPTGRAFRMILRLYKPINVSGILSGATWQPPTILPCLPDGKTSEGVACAS
jgi:hypothetical protein